MKVRALTFKKRFANIQHDRNWWATLGHTDEMECTELKDMTLSSINNFNNETFIKDSATAYHHVIYLIDSEPDNNQSPDNELWESDGFLSVTRIHFPNTTGLQDQFDKLNRHLEGLSSIEAYEGVHWRTYYTMELSDVVLVSKSTSFQKLSRWSLFATKCKFVGKAYTYFCIPGNMLDLSESHLSAKLENDFIDFVAIRFVVRSYGAESTLLTVWETLGKDRIGPPFRVAGNEDAIISGQNIPVLNLIKLYQSWYRDDSIFKTFRDISTRIGADWEKYPITGENEEIEKSESGASDNIPKLEQISCLVLDKVQRLVLTGGISEVSPETREWIRPLVELTNALVHMSNSATLDESVFQILPGLNAFWDNVIGESESLIDEPLYLHFAELCVHTMEHLMRAEGQLSQRLEVRPLAYDIPVFILEYVTTFLLTLSQEMTKPDGSNAERICFLLAPDAEKGVSTVEPFRATEHTPGLLLITVPFSLLYNPERLIPALCHEIAHYVGEALRLREQRYDLFLECAAMELITYFFNDVSGDISKLKKYVKECFLDENLRAGTDDLIELYGSFEKIPLLQIVEKIFTLAYTLIDTDAYAEFVRDYVLSSLRGTRVNSISEQIRKQKLGQFTDRMRDLSITFREAYADICMVYFLKISSEKYLQLIMHQNEHLNSGMILRVFVVLSANGDSAIDIQNEFDRWGKANELDSVVRAQIHDEIQDIATQINSTEGTSERFLAEYIKQCLASLKANCKLDGEKADGYKYSSYDIYKKILNLNTTSYPDILNVIDNGRQIALDQLETALRLYGNPS